MIKSIWKQDLEAAGAEFDEVGVESFGNPEQETAIALTGNVYADLSHRDLVGVSGDDAMNLLQGQFTNDVREVDDEHAQISAWCNPKGRVLYSFLLFQREGSYYMSLPPGQAEAFIKRLKMFVLMAKVTIVDASGQWVRLGCSGPDMDAELHKALASPVPAEPYLATRVAGLTIIRLPGVHPRFEVIGDAEGMIGLRERLDVDCTGIGRVAWQRLEIAAGVAVVDAANQEAFVPQMINLATVGGVSFNKGCYTGQEVVARMEYLGKLKRRMYRAQVAASQAPTAGDELWAPKADSAQGVGRVVNVAQSADGAYDLLAVVRIADYEHGEVRLKGAEGVRLEFIDLPYDSEA